MKDYKLADSFFYSEFTNTRHPIENEVPEEYMPNLRRLARVLQHIRNYMGHPVIVTSGYRSPDLNRIVGGAARSHHMQAAAADWVCPAFGSPLECADAVARHMDMWHITQVIHEFGGWVHCSILPVGEANRIITIDRRGTRAGLHPAR